MGHEPHRGRHHRGRWRDRPVDRVRAVPARRAGARDRRACGGGAADLFPPTRSLGQVRPCIGGKSATQSRPGVRRNAHTFQGCLLLVWSFFSVLLGDPMLADAKTMLQRVKVKSLTPWAAFAIAKGTADIACGNTITMTSSGNQASHLMRVRHKLPHPRTPPHLRLRLLRSGQSSRRRDPDL